MAAGEKHYITVEEFFRIAETSQQRMELIGGEIINLSAPTQLHQELVWQLAYEIRDYILKNKFENKSMIQPFGVVLGEDVVQPDMMVICDPSKINGKRCRVVPDWVIEVTSSNFRTDYAEKLLIYRNAGVREYWIVDTEQQKIFVYLFEQSPNVVNFYDWCDSIPVNIYKNAEVQLSICINTLISLT